MTNPKQEEIEKVFAVKLDVALRAYMDGGSIHELISNVANVGYTAGHKAAKAESPWCYDMDKAPKDGTPLLLYREFPKEYRFSDSCPLTLGAYREKSEFVSTSMFYSLTGQTIGHSFIVAWRLPDFPPPPPKESN